MKKLVSLLLAVAMLLAVVPEVTVLAAKEPEAAIFTDESSWPKETEQRRAEIERFRAEEEVRYKELEAENAERRMALGISEDGVHPTRPAEPTTVQDGAALMSTDGTYSEVVYIETVEDLLAIDGHKNGYYELMNDLNISGMEWKPLCLPGGVFNGNGHTISGMTITEVSENSEACTIGFFSRYYGSLYAYDLNLENIDIDVDISSLYGMDSSISALGDAYADTCSVEGSINITNVIDTDNFGEWVISAISGGMDCIADVNINISHVFAGKFETFVNNILVFSLENCANSINYGDINITTTGFGSTNYSGNSNIFGFYNCVNSLNYGDIIVQTNHSIFRRYDDFSHIAGLYRCANCEMYGDISCFDSYRVSAIESSENCVYKGNIETVNTLFTIGIESGEGCTIIGNITSAMTHDIYDMDGSMYSGYVIAMEYTTDCMIQGDISAADSCYLIYHAEDCVIYGDICADGISGMWASTNCCIFGDLTATSGVTGISGDEIHDESSDNYIGGNITVTYGHAYGIRESRDSVINGNITVYGCRGAIGIEGGSDNCIKGNIKVTIDPSDHFSPIVGGVYGIMGGTNNYLSGTVQNTFYGYTGTASRHANWAQLVFCDNCGTMFTICESTDSVHRYHKHVHCINSRGEPFDIDTIEIACYDSSGGSLPNPGEDTENPTTPDPKAKYTLKIIDVQTDAPLAGAVVTVDAKEYTTDANGMVTLSNAPITGGLKVVHGGSVVIAQSDFRPIPNQVNVIYVNGINIDAEDFFAGNGGSTLITGPQADVFDKKINLFEFPFGFEFQFFNRCEVAYDREKKVYQVIGRMGEKDDSESVEALRDAAEKKWATAFTKVKHECELAKNHKLTEEYDLDSVPGKLGPDGKISAALFLELKPEGNGFRLISGGAYIKFEGEYKGGAPLASMPIVYLAYGVSGELLADAKIEFEKATLIDPKFSIAADITAELTPYIGAGLGWQDALSVEAGLKGKLGMELNLPMEELSEGLRIDLTGQVYFLITALWHKVGYTHDFLKAELYPNPGIELMSVKDISDYSIIDRSYLNAAIPMALSADTVKNGIYPYGGVKTGVLSDGRVIMVWLDDDTSRNLVNKTALYYSILENGRWSAPAQIENDGTADFDFDLKVSGNKAALVWQDSRAALKESASLESAAAVIELSYAEFDGAKWSAPITVTSGNSDYEYSPSLYYDGNAYIAWKQNSENSALPDTDIESVYSTAVSGGKVSEVKPEYEDMPLIYGLAVGKGGSVAIITDDASASGRVLYVDGTENYKSASRLSGLCYDNGFCFTENGTVQKAQLHGSYPKPLYQGGNAEKIAYITGHGHRAAVYEVQNEYTSNLYASYHEERGWTNPVPITDFDEKIRSWDAHIDENGNIVIGAVLANIVIENETINDSARLVYTTTRPIEDIAVNTVTAKGDVTPGKMAEFAVNVTNNTKNDITSIDIALNGRDAQLYSGVQTVNIPAGASADIAVNVMIPSDFDAQTVTADITVPDLTESNKNNNTASDDFGAGNLKVELKGSSIMSDGTAQAVIKNTGCADVTDVILTVIGENGENIYTGELGTVAGGETKKIRFELDSSYYTFDGDNDSFIITATVDGNGDTLQFDNESTYCISRQSAEIISFAQTQAVMSVGDVYSPQVNVYPKNTSAEVYLVSDNENVAVVENGVITAVGNGTATITAMASGTAMTAKMTVYVRDLSAPVITSAEYHDYGDISGTYGDVYVSVDLTGCLEYGEVERMIIAVYAEDDELIGIVTNGVTANRYDGICISTRNKKPKYVKAFIWNRLAGMMPAALATAKEITEIN